MQHLIFPAFKTIIWMQLTFVRKKKDTIKIYINAYPCEISSYYAILPHLFFQESHNVLKVWHQLTMKDDLCKQADY